MFLGQVFVKKAKNDPGYFLKSPNRAKFENGENAEILVNRAKSGLFGHSKPGLRSRSRDRSWGRSELTVLVGAGVGAGVDKIMQTPTPARSRRIPTVNRR